MNAAARTATTDGTTVTATPQDRYRLLVDALTDYAIYMLDLDGRVTSWNPGAERLKGYRAQEILGEHFSRFYTDEDRSAGLPQNALATAAREGRFEAEGWHVRKDGTRFWANVIIDPIRDAGGHLLGYAKITRDLSERRTAEEALRRSDQQFRLLVQSVTDYAIYMLDPNGNVTNWNLGAQRIKGYAPEEIVGQHFSRFYTEEDRARGEPQRALDRALAEGRYEREGWRVRKDGTRFWANVVVDPIRDADGTLLGFAKVTRDITERTNAQRELEQAREAFFQAQKLESIGQLTGGIAHDFNNLLTAVIASLELLRKRLPDDPRNVQLVDNALEGAQRGASLTRRMLAFARRQALEVVPLDVADLVAGMTGLLERSLGPQIGIRTDFAQNLAPVRADANQLESAVLNLAVNARDAMPAEGGEIVISATNEAVGANDAMGLAPGAYVCLRVTDSGAGMDADTLNRATEPFFTTKGIGKGTGLGLSMVHGMADQLGGKLTLKSRPGEGTTAEIWLPAADIAEIAQPSPAAEEPEPRANQPSTLTVLAVDDDGLVLMNTTAMLEDMGHRVLEASSGKKALDLLSREPEIDLVITDQAMPQMTGLELAREIRQQRPDLPVIIATGYAELPAAGGDFLKLDKPFFEQQLAQAIATVHRGR